MVIAVELTTCIVYKHFSEALESIGTLAGVGIAGSGLQVLVLLALCCRCWHCWLYVAGVGIAGLCVAGVGIAGLCVATYILIYYNVIVAWCLYYFFASMNTVLPWDSCGNWWNSPNCIEPGNNSYRSPIKYFRQKIES